MDTIDQVQEQETALTEKQKVKALRARKKQEAEEKLARDPFLPSPENPPTETREPLQETQEATPSPQETPNQQIVSPKGKRQETQAELFPMDAKIRDIKSKLPAIRKKIGDDLELVGEFAKLFSTMVKWGDALDSFNELDALRLTVKVGITKADELLRTVQEVNGDLQEFDDLREELNRLEALRAANGNSSSEPEEGGEEIGVGEARESDEPAAEEDPATTLDDPDFREVDEPKEATENSLGNQ